MVVVVPISLLGTPGSAGVDAGEGDDVIALADSDLTSADSIRWCGY